MTVVGTYLKIQQYVRQLALTRVYRKALGHVRTQLMPDACPEQPTK